MNHAARAAFYAIYNIIIIKRCCMIDNETTLHQRSNDIEVTTIVQPYDLQR